MVQKIYLKMHPVSCSDTHHYVKYLVNHVMVKNTKTWIFWEQKITFLRNKKIFNLCLRWHILRSYYFVSEVTFAFSNKNFHFFAIKTGYSEQLNKSRNKLSSIRAILDFFCIYRYGLVNSFQKKCYVIFNDIIPWYISNWFLYFAYFYARFQTIFIIFYKKNVDDFFVF